MIMKKERKMRFKPDYSSRFRILKGGKISLVVSAFLGSVTLSFAAPSGGVVTSGSATINQSGKVTNINQSTQKASINWQKFNVAIDETVNFNQPNVNSITLNRVVGKERSVINGALNANGQVWILNSNGVLFGKNASINTAGLLATTKELSDQDFQAGNYTFKGDSTASVINLGEIDISDSGYVTLLANSVSNEGSIKAIKGSVRLIGANEVAINFNGNSIVDLTVNKGVLDALVENKGAIYADGGQVYLTTNAVDELLKGVVNNEGIIEANSFESVTGYVELFAHGGTANISGNINAVDGFVETSGDRVKIDDDFRVKANKWLIDPKDFTIAASGGDITGATLSSNLENASVEIQSVNGATDGDGDIFVNDAISWDAATKLTLNAQNDIFINQSITATNAAGQLALYYGQGAVSTGNTADYYVKAPINLKAGNNFFIKKGNNGAETIWTVITHENLATAITTGGLGHNYVLGSNLNLSGIAWSPIGTSSANAFTGNFDGLGHVIDNLTINDNSLAPAGLFGYTTDATIKNIGLTNVNISARARIGGLVGQANNTTIKNVFAEGFITGATNDRIGGLVGYSNGSNIDNSYAKVNIIISDNSSVSQAVGGLVGWNYSASSVIKNSYSSGTITLNTDSSSRTNIGGLVGKNDGNINTSYYDKNRNTANMADSATYGKTKAEIVTALSSLDAWTAGDAGGDSVEGYSTATALTLPQLVAFYTSNGEILFAGGFGTEADPYTITNWTQLQNINHVADGGYAFELSNNIDLQGIIWTPIGASDRMFNGNFNGQNNTISNLTIDVPSEGHQALFGYMENGTIKNLKLNDTSITAESYVAGLVGNINATTDANIRIENIEFNNLTINAYADSNSDTYAGGVVGRIEVQDETSNIALESIMINGLKIIQSGTGSYIGGITGMSQHYNEDADAGQITLRKLAVRDAVIDAKESEYVGGLVGRLRENSSLDDRNLFIGTVDGGYRVGGLVGRLSSNSVLNFGYVQADVTGHAYGVGYGEVGLIAGYTSNKDQTVTEIYAAGTASHSDPSILNWGQEIGVIGSSGSDGDLYEDVYYHVTDGTLPFFGNDDAQPTMTNVTELTQTQMQGSNAKENMEGVADTSRWDFDTNWLANKDAYPIFKWESDEFDVAFEDPTPNPDPTPDPKPDTLVKVDKVITTIVNKKVTKVNIPAFKTTTTTPNNAGQNVAINFNIGGNQMLISQPIEGQLTQRITLGEARQMQLESGVSGEEVRIPLSRSSMIELVNGGVNLPDGVEQEFYVAENN